MKQYTVLLLYPDYRCDSGNSGQTYMTTVMVENPKEAQRNAQKEVFDDEQDGSPEDYLVLCVIEGEHKDVKDLS